MSVNAIYSTWEKWLMDSNQIGTYSYLSTNKGVTRS